MIVRGSGAILEQLYNIFIWLEEITLGGHLDIDVKKTVSKEDSWVFFMMTRHQIENSEEN